MNILQQTITNYHYYSLVTQMVKHLPTMWETWVRSLGQDDLLEKEMATQPVLLPGKSHGRRSMVGYSPWGRKESDTTKRLHFHCHYCHHHHHHHHHYKQLVTSSYSAPGNVLSTSFEPMSTSP